MIRFRIRDTARNGTVFESDDLFRIDGVWARRHREGLDVWVIQWKDAEAPQGHPLADWTDVPWPELLNRRREIAEQRRRDAAIWRQDARP